MNPQLIALCLEIALRLGPAFYRQLSDLLGPSIPAWDDLAVDNAELQAMIDAEKVKP